MASAAVLQIPSLSSSPSSLSTTMPNDTSHRQGLVSTHSLVSSPATSFRTAPLASYAASASSSRSSSTHTLAQDNANHCSLPPPQSQLSSQHQEVQILQVDALEVRNVKSVRASAPSALHTTPNGLKMVDNGPLHVGPPPPSPPASIEFGDISSAAPLPSAYSESVTFAGSNGEDQVFSDEPESTVLERIPSASTASTSNRITHVRASTIAVSHSTSIDSSRLSSEPKSSFSTLRTLPRMTAHSEVDGAVDDNVHHTLPSIASSSGSILKPTDFLQPPPVSMHPRPTRRNTTGGSGLGTRLGLTNSRGSAHVQYGSQPPTASVFDENVMDDMASDIQLHAEQIRRERMEKRAKQQADAEAEAALTQAHVAGSSGKRGEDVPLVGNLIGEDHVNYVLMYNMLTGIRIGVSRCQAKIKRPLTDDDFTAKHKFSFDIVGNELTPSAKYDFKFKDYAPWVFRSLREEYFHLDPADYLLSLTSKYILSELGSPGKSGSFFYFSRDYRFIIKTIHHNEHKFLLRVLKQYYEHVKDNPHTLLSRFYGLHRVKLPRGRKIHFVIMNNLFPPHKDIHETYDLKGSTVGREFPEEKSKDNPVLKDLNWLNREKMLELGPEKRALLTEQLRRDKEMLKKIYVMDYSLLVGIHNMQRGNRDNLRKNTLKVFDPDIRRHGGAHTKGARSPEAMAMRRAMRESDPKRLGKGTIHLPEQLGDTEDRQHFIFYQDEGGLRATDENNENMATIYYLGVIDILTPYSGKKKLEHIWKGLSADRHKISPVPPEEYAERFFCFMKAIMRGGGGGESFRP